MAIDEQVSGALGDFFGGGDKDEGEPQLPPEYPEGEFEPAPEPPGDVSGSPVEGEGPPLDIFATLFVAILLAILEILGLTFLA